MLYRISVILVHGLLKLFCKLEVKGREAFWAERPFILAANHSSNLDPPLLAVVSPRKIAFLAKKELFANRLFARYLHSVGAIPLSRDKTDLTAIRLSLETLKSRPLLVFPQGRRSADLEAINSGVGFLCKKAKVPVIAARVEGTDKVLPPDAKFLHRGRIKVTFARVDTISAVDTYEDITRKVMAKIKSLD